MNAAAGSAKIGVIGAGTMGRGIVQLFAQAGHEVYCYDALSGAAQAAAGYALGMLRRALDKGRITASELAVVASRIHACDALADLVSCDIVIEAVVEDLTVKLDLFRSLERLMPETTILATNTSSLLISVIGGGCARPEQIAGLHFFNPVPLMKVVEVIRGVRTSDATAQTLLALVNATGHRAVLSVDQPGFIVNHAGRGLYTEGLRLLEEQVADVLDIDRLLREAAGFRMGPFELMDLTGLDVSGKVMESVYEQFFQEPRFRPSPLVRPRVAAGLYGRKTGRGWYMYEGDQQCDPVPRSASDVTCTNVCVWVDPDADECEAIGCLATAAGARLVGAAKIADLVVVQCWGNDASGYCATHGLDPRRCVAIDPLPGLAHHRTLMMTAATGVEARDLAVALFTSDAVATTLINDSPGFVVQRVLATVVNIACDMAQRGIASVADIEAAVSLGLGYPRGPLSWGDLIGPARILNILTAIGLATGDPRYRPSPWLRRRALLGMSLLTTESRRQLSQQVAR